jgi:hypothetical protein
VRRFAIVPVVVLLSAVFMVLKPHVPGTTVALRDFRYSPSALVLRVGDAVSFVNDSKLTHTATCTNCTLDTGDVQPGLSRSITFREPGVYLFACRYHGDRGMTMQITVGGNGGATPAASLSPAATPST